MKKKPLAWLILGSIGCFLVIIVPSLTGSLWFLHALLGDSTHGYTVGYVHSFVHSHELLKKFEIEQAAYLPEHRDAYNRFVYRKDQSAEYLVGIPRVAFQISLARQLKAESWHVQRIGWVLYAQREATSQVRPVRSMGKTVQAVSWERLPAFPRLILQVHDSTSESAAIYIEEKQSGYYAAVNTGTLRFVRGSRNRFSKEVLQDKTSYVSIQRDVLSLVPGGVATSLENKVSESLHFTKTRPEILGSLLSITPSVVLARDGNSFAIGLPSTDERAAQLIHRWMHAEQGTRHPQKRAFSLPDRTLGYEYIPGVSNAKFALNKANNNCLPSEEYDESLFLCAKDSVLVLANNEALGNGLLGSLKDPEMFTKGVVQGGMLDAVGLGSQARKLEYVVVDEIMEFWLDKKI